MLLKEYDEISKNPNEMDYKRVYIEKAGGKYRPLGVPKPA